MTREKKIVLVTNALALALLLTMLFVPVTHAIEVGRTTNDAGGTIYFDDVPCADKRGYKAFVKNDKGLSYHGCWKYEGGIYTADWDIGLVRQYRQEEVNLSEIFLVRLRAWQEEQKKKANSY